MPPLKTVSFIVKYSGIAMLGCVPSLVCAQQTPSLEQLLKTQLSDLPQHIETTTATRYAQSSNQSATVTYVVTAADIDMFQWQTLAEVLQSLPGIYITTDSIFQYVGIRGLGQPGDFNSRLLFLIDGVRINENVYDAALVGTDAMIDVENIDRIEFAAGPGAAIYGNNAFFGVVNILTKSAQQLRGGAVQMTVRDDTTNRYFFSTAHRLEQGSEWWFSASHQHQNEIPLAFPALPQFEQGFLDHNNEHLSRLRLGAKHQGLRFQLLWAGQERNSPTLMSSPDGVETLPVRDQNDNLLLSLAHSHAVTENITVSGHLNHSNNRYRRDIPIYEPDVGRSSFYDDQIGRWFSGDLVLQYQGLLEHDLLVGIELQDDLRQQLEVRLGSQRELLQGFYGKNQRKSAFIQDQWQLFANHSLLVGMRYDESKVSDPRLSPRLGWVWQMSPDQSLKLLRGNAYRSANLYEFAVNDSFAIPSLHDEEITSTELTYEQQWSRQLSYRISGFYADIHQLIALSPETAAFINTPELHNLGAEVNLDWRLTNGAMLSATWSWQQGQDALKQDLQNSPQHLVKLQYQQWVPYINAHLSTMIIGTTQRQAGDLTLPGSVMAQLGLNWQLAEQHQLSMKFNNLLDTMVSDRPLLDRPTFVRPGRTFSLSWRWQLW